MYPDAPFISPRAREGSLTIVGDWFVADSLVPRPEGYRQIVFRWHAPTVLQSVKEFDREFEELYAKSELGENASRGEVINQIEDIMSRLG